MGQLVVTGAMMQCSFGATLTFMGSAENKTNACSVPAATIMDNVPFKNLIPAGVCTSMANPSVASATAAAWGVLTPMPCVPVFPAPWTPGSATVMISNKPALNNTCTLTCSYGGIISITYPGQVQVQVP